MSYNGVGLSTARGSGTNGFVQRNLSSIKHKPIVKKDISHYTHAPQNQIKAANKDILDHEKKRSVEVKCVELEEELLEKGLDPDEIENRIDVYRKELLENMSAFEESQKKMKEFQVHQLAEAKERDTKRFGQALGITDDYEPGASFNPERQAQLKQAKMLERQERQEEYARKKELELRERENRFNRRPRSRSPPPRRSRSRSFSRSRTPPRRRRCDSP